MEELVLEKEKQKLKKKKEKVINENVELKLELVQLIYSVLNQLQDNKFQFETTTVLAQIGSAAQLFLALTVSGSISGRVPTKLVD